MKRSMMMLLVLALFAMPVMAQEEDGFFELDLDVAAGWGSRFGEEDETFSRDAQFAAFHVDLLGIDFLDSTSGVALEVAFGGTLEYRVWSKNRAEVPGTGGRVYGGTDFKIFQSTQNQGLESDFDARVVVGTHLVKIWRGELDFETYALEEGDPMRFVFLYGVRFGR